MKHLLGILCLAITIGMFVPSSGTDVFAQERAQKAERVDVSQHSYFGSVEKGKDLFAEESELLQKKTKVSIPLPGFFPVVKKFFVDLKALAPFYFQFLLYGALLLLPLFQFYLAQALHQRRPWFALSSWGIGILMLIQAYTSLDLVAVPLLMTFFLIPSVIQLFQLSHVDFIQTFFINLGFFIIVYLGVILDSPQLINWMYIVWGLYLVTLYLRVFSNTAFNSGRSSWVVLSTFIPIIGLPLYMLACLYSIMKKDKMSPKFVNIILSLLKKGQNRIAIRQYALNAKIRLEYFEHNFAHASRLFKSGKVKVSGSLYRIKYIVVGVLLVCFALLGLGQVVLSTLALKEYKDSFVQNKTQEQLYKALEDDNLLLFQNLLNEGKIKTNLDCETSTVSPCSLLYKAIDDNSLAIIPALLESGSGDVFLNKEGESPLQYAERTKKNEQILELLGKGKGVKR